MQSGRRERRVGTWGALVLVLLLVTGCGSGGGASGAATPTTSAATTEQVSVALTDAASADITAFVADVTSIQLVKANGVTVSVLPNRTTINFAELTQLSELVTAATVPSGTYVSMAMDLSFAGENALVTLVGGGSTADGSVVLKDGQGQPLTSLTVKVSFGNDRPLVVTPGLPTHVLLDFDLNQSCVVDDLVTPKTVTVRPVLSADAQLQRPVVTRVRGLLKSVDQGAGSFKLEVRPLTPAASGEIALATDATTVFLGPDADGNGQSNLADLAGAPPGTPVTARGQFNGAVGRFLASQVEYGEAVPGGTRDVAEGLVRRISGNTFTLIGCTVSRSGGGVTFNTTITATLDATTPVRRPGSAGPAGTGVIGIGQRLVMGGRLSGSPPNVAIDCTAAAGGGAGLLETQVIGIVQSVGAGVLTLGAKIIGRRPVTEFDFAGAGIDPRQYAVNTATLNVSALAAGEVVLCTGFVTPGSATAFAARAVISLPVDVLIARWAPPGTAAPFATTPPAFPLTLNLAGSPPGGLVVTNPGRVTVLTASPTLALGSSPRGAGVPPGPFVIRQGETITVFDGDGSTAWLTEVNARVAGGATVLGLTAFGRFDGTTPGTFTLSGMGAELR